MRQDDLQVREIQRDLVHVRGPGVLQWCTARKGRGHVDEDGKRMLLAVRVNIAIARVQRMHSLIDGRELDTPAMQFTVAAFQFLAEARATRINRSEKD